MSASEKAGNKNLTYYINVVVSLVLMLGIGFLPAVEPITPLGMQILGLFIGAIYAWTTVGLVWPSLLGLVLLGLTDYTTVNDAFQSGFGGSTTMFILFVLVFAYIVDKAGVTGYIARGIVSSKIGRGRPWVLSLLILTAAFVVAALVSLTPAVILVWSLLYQLCDAYGYKKFEKYPTAMIVGILIASLMGQTAFPFKVHAIAMLGILDSQAGMTIDFVTFTVMSIIVGYAIVLVYLALLKFVFRLDVSRMKDGNFSYEGAGKLTSYQKGILGLLVLFIALMMAPSVLPAGSAAADFFKQLGSTGATVLLIALLGIFRKASGQPLVDLVSSFKEGVAWPVIFLVSCALALATAVVSDDAGIKAFLIQTLGPVFGGSGNAFLFLLIGTFIILAITNCSNNLTTGLIMLPILLTFCGEVGLDPRLVTILVCTMMNFAIILPSAVPVAAMTHANEWVKSNDLYRYTIPTVIVGGIVGCILYLVMGPIFFH